MKSNSIYKISASVADELLLSLGGLHTKGNTIYIEFLMFSFYLCGLASTSMLNRNFTKDNFVSVLMLQRDDFYCGNITELTQEANSAFDDYNKNLYSWPVQKNVETCHLILQCLLFILHNKKWITNDCNYQVKLKSKIIDAMIVIENIYKRAEIDELMNEDVGCASQFREEGGSKEQMEITNNELLKQYLFIKNKIPSALSIAILLGMILIFIIDVI